MTADEIIVKVKDLPVISETARRLTLQLNQPDLHRQELVQTLRQDNILTAKLLRACNCAGIAVPNPVTSVDQALFILGDKAVFRIVSALGFGDCLGLNAPSYDEEANDLWSHSLSVAVGAEHLVGIEAYGDCLTSTAFTAGLLHDIGKAVINRVLTPKKRDEIRAEIVSRDGRRIEAERAVLGTDHCEVGACLLRRWSLPEAIAEAAARHHAPATEPEVQLSAVVCLADLAAHVDGVLPGWEERLDQAGLAASDALGMDVRRAKEIVASVHTAMQTLPQFETN